MNETRDFPTLDFLYFRVSKEMRLFWKKSVTYDRTTCLHINVCKPVSRTGHAWIWKDYHKQTLLEQSIGGLTWNIIFLKKLHATFRSKYVGCTLQVGRTRDRFQAVTHGVYSIAADISVCPGVDSASKNEYQDIPGCVKVTTLPPSCAECLVIWSLNRPEPSGPHRPVIGLLYLLLCIMSCTRRTGFAYKIDNLQLRASYYRVRINEIKINL